MWSWGLELNTQASLFSHLLGLLTDWTQTEGTGQGKVTPRTEGRVKSGPRGASGAFHWTVVSGPPSLYLYDFISDALQRHLYTYLFLCLKCPAPRSLRSSLFPDIQTTLPIKSRACPSLLHSTHHLWTHPVICLLSHYCLSLQQPKTVPAAPSKCLSVWKMERTGSRGSSASCPEFPLSPSQMDKEVWKVEIRKEDDVGWRVGRPKWSTPYTIRTSELEHINIARMPWDPWRKCAF